MGISSVWGLGVIMETPIKKNMESETATGVL